MTTEDTYSYTGNKSRCSTSSCTVGLAQGSVTGFEDVNVNSVEGLMTALTQPSVSVTIDTDSVFFQYSGVVMQFWCGTNLDHAVLAVGYGTDGSTLCGISSGPLKESCATVAQLRALLPNFSRVMWTSSTPPTPEIYLFS